MDQAPSPTLSAAPHPLQALIRAAVEAIDREDFDALLGF
jgi:hypothetical protein